MKILKLSLVAILMMLVLASCGDDNTTDLDEDPVTPTSKVTITTLVDGEEMDVKVVQGKDGEFTPSDYQLSGFYTNLNGLFNMIILGETNSENSFTVNLYAILNELKAGTYNLVSDGETNYGSYTNRKFGEDQYTSTSITLVLTKVNYIALTDIVGNYYITGTLTMELENEYNANPNVTVNMSFQDMPVTKSITGF